MPMKWPYEVPEVPPWRKDPAQRYVEYYYLLVASLTGQLNETQFARLQEVWQTSWRAGNFTNLKKTCVMIYVMVIDHFDHSRTSFFGEGFHK